MLRVLVIRADGKATWQEVSAESSCKDLATGAAKTPTWCPFLLVHEVLARFVEKHAEDLSSFAADPQQLWGYDAQLMRQARRK